MSRRKKNEPCVVVFVTCPNRIVARRVAGSLLKDKLAACVNILPCIESRFLWQGRIQRAAEFLLFIKTPKRFFPKLKRAILCLHPYEVPEIIALPILDGHRPYLEWLSQETRNT